MVFKDKNNIFRIIIVTQPSSLITVNVKINDIDDNRPIFNEKFKNISILENTPLDSKIILPTAHDMDDGENGRIKKYYIESNEKYIPFELSRSTIEGEEDILYLVIKNILDREKQSIYNFSLIATGSYKNKIIETKLPITIHITDVNDNAPIFTKTNYTITLTSQIRKDNIIGKVEAIDEDEGENGKVKYKLNSNSFEINENTGEIKLSKDKVNCSNSCILIIEASDNGSEVLRSRTFVTVKSFEENLHVPEISFRLYPPGIDFGNVLENATLGSTIAVLTIKDDDKGVNGDTSIKIINGNEKDYFYLEKGRNFGILRVNENWVKVNKKKRKFKTNEKFTLTFEASDSGVPSKKSTKELNIFIRPSEDIPPVLAQSIIKTKINEDEEIGVFIGRVIPDNRKEILEYTIVNKNENNYNDYFYLNKESGYIFLKKKIDKKLKKDFSLEISVKKQAPYITSSICRIDVTIIEVNNKPKFEKNIWKFNIPQNATKDYVIGRVKASDDDSNENGIIRYEIYDPTSILKKIFSINVRTGDISVINNELFKDIKKYSLTIIAKDKGKDPKEDRCYVIITIDDKNDSEPYFEVINNYKGIKLHEFPDTILYKMVGNSNNKGKLSYHLINNDYNDILELNHKTGEIILKKKINDKFKVGDAFIVEVGIKDNYDNYGKENAKIIFEIINDDENLNAFKSNNVWEYFIDDFVKVNDIIGKIHVVSGFDDNFEILNCNNFIEIDKNNGELVFKNIFEKEKIICIIKLGKATKEVHFKRNRTGIVRLSDKITSDINQIQSLISIYTINNHKKPIKRLKLKVLLQNRREEEKRYDFLHLSIEENSPIGTIVGEIMTNRKVGWRFNNTTFDGTKKISILSNGSIIITGIIDREKETSLEEIFTNGIEIIKVYVTIIDVNDNYPTCDSNQKFVVSNKLETFSTIGFIKCNDNDFGINSILTYKLLSHSEIFFIDSFNGEIKNLKKIIDKENKILVEVKDLGGLKIKTEIIVTTNEDKNEEVIFDNNYYYWDMNIIDSIKVKAKGNITYKLGNYANLFNISKTGRIKLKEKKYLLPITTYNLTVNALLYGDTKIIGSTFVLIEPLKEMKIKPIFKEFQSPIKVDDNISPGSIITKIEASVYDERISTVSLDNILYTISGEDNYNGTFYIDLYSGEIILTKYLSKLIKNMYILKIKAVGGNGMISEKEVKIQVENGYNKKRKEINFDFISDVFSIEENNIENSFVGELKFIDENMDVEINLLFDTTLNNYFEIRNRKIFIKKSIDREEYDKVGLLIEIRKDLMLLRKWIYIKIEDKNDNYPECNGINSVIITKLPLTVSLPCYDNDYDINSSLGYSMVESKEMNKYKNIISIDENGDIIIDKKFSKMDFKEKPSYISLNVFDRAFDSKNGFIVHDNLRKVTQRQVALIKWKENDTFKFVKNNYVINIEDYHNIGDIIGKIEATMECFIFIVEQLIDGVNVNNKNYFDISDEGNIKLRRKIENSIKLFKLKLVGVTRNGYTATVDVIIKIDTDKYILNFEKISLPKIVTFTIDDEYSIGDVVGNVSKLLFSRNVNNLLQFSWKDYEKNNEMGEMFEINKNTGIITLKKKINVNRTNIYCSVIKISITSVEDIDLSIPISINIENNVTKKPKVRSCISNEKYFIREDAPIDTVIGKINVEEVEGEKYFYEIINSPKNVKIDDETGILYVNDLFDHEKESFYKMKISVKNKLNASTTCDTYLFIEDINDNKPQIINKDMIIDVDEDTKVGEKIFTLDIFDLDSDSYFNYKISPKSNPYGIFNINQDDGSIVLEKNLDYEKDKEHEIEIIVYDNIFPNIVNYVKGTLTIIVNNVNDNSPTFDSDMSTFFIEKTKMKGDLIGIINAIDKDEDYGGMVHYRIIHDTLPGNEFYIDNVYGYLYLNSGNITKNEINFIVEAYDNGDPMLSSTHKVKIIKEKVLAINDNEKEIIKIKVKENLPIGSLLGRLEKNINIIGYSSSSMCKYYYNTGGIFLNENLDYEVIQQFSCTIKTTDGNTLGQLIVEIEDINDNIPIFYESNKEVFISENLLDLPIKITRMNVFDNDKNMNSMIQYSLIEGDLEYFSINSTNGDIYLKKSLDREEKNKHILKIAAFDSGIVANKNYGFVYVNVIDVNDNEPKFLKPLYYIKIEENNKPIDNLIQVTAIDEDESENSFIVYKIKNDESDFIGTFPFTINSKTGQISLIKSLDYEDKMKWNFTVIAEDSGIYNVLSSQVSVIIEVKNTEDRVGPIIRNTLFDVYIKENTKRDNIIYTIDAVENVGNKIYKSDGLKYFITDIDSQYFYVDEYGIIYLKDNLEEGKNNYDITFIVQDSALNNSTNKLSIYIATQSKFAKLLPLMKSRIALKEDSKDVDVLKIVGNNNGNEDSVIRYYIASGDSNNDFYIDSFTGVLSVKKLNREISTGYNLIIGVSLSNFIAYPSYERIQIHVIDVNDKPRFVLPIYEVEVEENIVVPRSLLIVNAIDNDSNDFNIITYSIISGNEDNEFSINNKTGEIIMVKSPDAEVKNKYVLRIEAKDNDNLSDETTMLLTIKDLNDNSPKFTRLFSPEIFENNEIDSKTGELKALKLLDRENINEYKLKVTSKDDFWQISTTFLVTVKDRNDNGPIFDNNSIVIKFNGNESFGDVLTQIKATDNDEGINGKITYRINHNLIDNIYIEPSSGKILFMKHLDKNENKKIIQVVASDMGEPVNESKMDIVIIQDNISTKSKLKNRDGMKNFENMEYLTIPMWENEKNNTKIIEFVEKVSILSISCPKHSNGICEKQNIFEIKNQSLYLIGNLDYETENEYIFRIKKNEGKIILKIEVLDVNEYIPIIIENNNTNVISKYSKENTIISLLESIDLDYGNGGNKYFYINTDKNNYGVNIDKNIGSIFIGKDSNLLSVNDDYIEFDVFVKNGKLDRRVPKQGNVKVKLSNDSPSPVFDKNEYKIIINYEDIVNSGKLIEFNFANYNYGDYIYSIYSKDKNYDNILCIDKKEGYIFICKDFKMNPIKKIDGKKFRYLITISENKGKRNKKEILRSKAVVVLKVNKKNEKMKKLISYINNGLEPNNNIAIVNIRKGEKVEIEDGNMKELFIIDENQKVLKNKKMIKRHTNELNYMVVPLKYTNVFGKIRKEILYLNVEDIKEDKDKIIVKEIIIQDSPEIINLGIYEKLPCLINYANIKNELDECSIELVKLEEMKNLMVIQNNISYKIDISRYDSYPTNGVWVQIKTIGSKEVGKILYKLQKKINDMKVKVISERYYKNNEIDKKTIFISIIDTFNKIINTIETKKIIKKFINDNRMDEKIKILNEDDCKEHCNEKTCKNELISIKSYKSYSYLSLNWYIPISYVKYHCIDDITKSDDIKKCYRRPYYVSQIFKENNELEKSSNCLNGGYCDLKLEVCKCPEGYKGSYCEEDINECEIDKNICKNSGNCINVPGSYKCLCDNGDEKINCDNIKNITNNCHHCKYGKCLYNNDWYCSCDKGYYGEKCDKEIYSYKFSSFIEVDIKNEDIEEINFDFITKEENGVLLYSYSLEDNFDYMAVDIINGNIRLSLNRSVTNEMINEFIYTPINDGVWKRLQIVFTHSSIIINLKFCNDKGTECITCSDDICKKEIETIYGRFSLPSKAFYLGGIGKDEEILKRSSQVYSPEFVGCMKDVIINSSPLSDYNVVKENLINYCPLTMKEKNCKEDICGKFGKCEEEYNSYKCKCNGIFNSDSSCKDIIQPISLRNGQVAFELTNNARRILEFISYNSSVIKDLPSYPSKNIQRRRMIGGKFLDTFSFHNNDNVVSSNHFSKVLLENQKFEIDFKTNESDGVLLSIYMINSPKIYMLEINNDTLNYSVYDGVTNIYTIEILKEISKIHWHRITMITSTNSPNTISFKLNGEIIVKTMEDKFIPRFINKYISVLLIGAAKSTSFIPFKGCVRRLIINDYGYSMINNINNQKIDNIFNLKHLGDVKIGCNIKSLNDNECDDCENDIDSDLTKNNDFKSIIVIAIIFLIIFIFISVIYFYINRYQLRKHKKNIKKEKEKKKKKNETEISIFDNLENIPRTFVSYQNHGLSSFSSYEDIGNNNTLNIRNGLINQGYNSNTLHITNTIDVPPTLSITNLSHIYDAPLINRNSIIQSNIFPKDYYQNPTLEMDETSNNGTSEKRCRRLVTFSPTNGISYINDNNYNYPTNYYINDDDSGKNSPYL
uniref:Cadherin n=1 Tax=Parastrongyloides trichosuri TaxID=131310 RepID=A0A0N4ZLK4_PARTI